MTHTTWGQYKRNTVLCVTDR